MDLVGLIAVMGAFAVPLYAIKVRYEERRRRLELEAGKGSGEDTEQVKRITDENRLLRERVENLETIVCSVDFELNQKIAKMIDEHRSGSMPGAAVAMPSPSTATPATDVKPDAKVAALDRTATQHPTPSSAKPLTTTLEPGQVLAQRYRVQRLLGKGGMGAVYLADDEVLGELVALKVISSAFASDEIAMAARFRREAAAARKVSSPNVIRIHDLGEARPGLLYLSMEYFAGRTLSELIAQRGMVPLDDTRDILKQVVTGLEAAHHAGVIHRDLKPSNVLIGERGAVKIIDFGLATTAIGDGLTATGAILGTPHYMAPEQIRGKPVDARTDIYALGALSYHLVCGRPPFHGDNAIAIGFAHLSEPPPPPRQVRRDVPPNLEAAILAALAKAPEDRPSSARAFHERSIGAS
ncbi:MAG: serine/threonine protein kinase [Deltaproteobacteria bacterium]|nr:serine/threonine protein kinase [Deltaproteobacteria bacterium]MDQ3299725.1 serine/threonine protein kinase [Myxococcota bacterium]